MVSGLFLSIPRNTIPSVIRRIDNGKEYNRIVKTLENPSDPSSSTREWGKVVHIVFHRLWAWTATPKIQLHSNRQIINDIDVEKMNEAQDTRKHYD
jgi:hypothetical protein